MCWHWDGNSSLPTSNQLSFHWYFSGRNLMNFHEMWLFFSETFAQLAKNPHKKIHFPLLFLRFSTPIPEARFEGGLPRGDAGEMENEWWVLLSGYKHMHTHILYIHTHEQLHLFTMMKTRCGIKQGLWKCWFRLQNEIKTRWGDSKNEVGLKHLKRY